MNGVKTILRGKRGNAEYLTREYTFHQGTLTSQRGKRGARRTRRGHRHFLEAAGRSDRRLPSSSSLGVRPFPEPGHKLAKSVSKECKLCIRAQKEICNKSTFFKKSAFFKCTDKTKLNLT